MTNIWKHTVALTIVISNSVPDADFGDFGDLGLPDVLVLVVVVPLVVVVVVPLVVPLVVVVVVAVVVVIVVAKIVVVVVDIIVGGTHISSILKPR